MTSFLMGYHHINDGVLNDQCLSCTQPDQDTFTLAFNDYWKVVLHPFQTHVGSTIITTRRHVGRVAELSLSEITTFPTVLGMVEDAVTAAFGIDLVNIMCLMNYAYREDKPDPKFVDGKPSPHVHWHVITRYKEPIEVGGVWFKDPLFGHPLDFGRKKAITPETRKAIRSAILTHLPLTYMDQP